MTVTSKQIQGMTTEELAESIALIQQEIEKRVRKLGVMDAKKQANRPRTPADRKLVYLP